MAAPASQPVDPLIADIRAKGAGQAASQPVDPLIADIRSRGVTGKSGTQTAIEDVKSTTNGAAAVRADTTLFDRGILKDFNAARTKLVDFARKHFPRQVINRETGRSIGISRTGLDKFLSGNIPFEKYASGFHIPELIERAHKIAQDTNQHTIQAESIPTYEYYDSPIQIEGVDYMAHIRVRNTIMGDKYYGHTISEVENIKIERPTRTSVPGDTPAVQPVNTGRSTKIGYPKPPKKSILKRGFPRRRPSPLPPYCRHPRRLM